VYIDITYTKMKVEIIRKTVARVQKFVREPRDLQYTVLV